MQIDQYTKISTLIKYNDTSIDAIASIAKPFHKLKNPILRKLFASRVTIEEAAKIGSCSVDDFKRVLVPLGFEWYDHNSTIDENPISTHSPAWLHQNNGIDFLDVRPILAGGKDPLKDIFKAYSQLNDHGVLCVINTFIPTPLIHRLQDKGAQTHVENIAENEINTYFYKSTNTIIQEPEHEQVIFIPFETLTQKLAAWDSDKIIQTDVRGLSMPQPMETILQLLQDLQENQILYVQHKKIPLYLLEELSDKNYKIYICKKTEEDVKILIQALKD